MLFQPFLLRSFVFISLMSEPLRIWIMSEFGLCQNFGLCLRSFSYWAPSLRKSRFAQERRAKERFQRAMCPALLFAQCFLLWFHTTTTTFLYSPLSIGNTLPSLPAGCCSVVHQSFWVIGTLADKVVINFWPLLSSLGSFSTELLHFKRSIIACFTYLLLHFLVRSILYTLIWSVPFLSVWLGPFFSVLYNLVDSILFNFTRSVPFFDVRYGPLCLIWSTPFIYLWSGPFHPLLTWSVPNFVQEECYRLILAKGGNHDLQDVNGCTVAHILVVYDNMKVRSKDYERDKD